MIDRLPSPLMGLVCRVFGHDWLDPWPREAQVFATQCKRCYRLATGSWDIMEAIGAWKHYR